MTPILVLVPEERGISALAQVPNVCAVVYDPESRRLPDIACDAEVLVAHRFDPADAGPLFAQLPRLRMVQLFSSGVERWTNVVPDGVRVSNADRAHGGAVAEWVVAQLLAHVRDLAGYRIKQQEQRWQAHPTGTLSDKRVLVFGAGDIGENLRRRLEPFGCTVTLVGRTARAGVMDVERGRAELGDQDVVILALPLDDSTVHLVDAVFLTTMKDGAVLVNAGRGELVDTEALLAATREERVYAILDVTDPEPLPADHGLWTAPGVVVTPHAAGITDDVRDRCWAAAVRKIAAYADGTDGSRVAVSR
ncbi:NAD(P)-dependent oxidoreductase [Rhodococcus sp. W8901]|uniref:NAD(P)-dependent oxidoreductase n=1 Tax=Rhodococcus sp. W8901 TaxID=2742603 RepID=UPI00158218BA|nr:NAD(P)-dependent oxidoreductase [Rhodococcus sp. W8901]QKT13500.1 dehydrogenase [Rhodococcus sp. W8901]